MEYESLGIEGLVFTNVENLGDVIRFTQDDGTVWKMEHFQDCCESVYVEDIAGDLEDLVGSPILQCEEASESGETGEWGDSSTWTYYKFSTIKGSVTIRWYGSSNGYYSESVSFYKENPEGSRYYW